MEPERLLLRSRKYEDRNIFAEMNGDRNVMKYFPATLSADESNSFADRINAEFEETGAGLYAVEIKETSEFIGYVGFHRFTFNAPFSSGWGIGWRISDRFWHKGYASEAAGACLDYAREKHFCNKLYSFTAVPNIPSENVMKRIVMSFQRTFMHPKLADGYWLKEHKLYSIDI